MTFDKWWDMVTSEKLMGKLDDRIKWLALSAWVKGQEEEREKHRWTAEICEE